jgi:hypothetical protein
LQVCECSDGIANYDPTVIENLLKFMGGFAALMCRQIRFAPHIDRIELSKVSLKVAARSTQLIRNGRLEHFDGSRRSP